MTTEMVVAKPDCPRSSLRSPRMEKVAHLSEARKTGFYTMNEAMYHTVRSELGDTDNFSEFANDSYLPSEDIKSEDGAIFLRRLFSEGVETGYETTPRKQVVVSKPCSQKLAILRLSQPSSPRNGSAVLTMGTISANNTPRRRIVDGSFAKVKLPHKSDFFPILDIHTKEYAETGVNTEAQIVDIAEILHSPDSPVLTPYKKPEVEMTNNYTPIPSPPESVTRANAAAGTVDTTPRKLSYVLMSSGREKDKAGLRKTSVSTAKQPVPANAKNTSLRKKSTLKDQEPAPASRKASTVSAARKRSTSTARKPSVQRKPLVKTKVTKHEEIRNDECYSLGSFDSISAVGSVVVSEGGIGDLSIVDTRSSIITTTSAEFVNMLLMKVLRVHGVRALSESLVNSVLEDEVTKLQ